MASMATWATYWTGPTARDQEGKAIDHIASDQFDEAGVVAGDTMYVITYADAHLHVVTSLVVDHVVPQERAEQILGRDLWEADWHVIARPGSVRRATMSASLSSKEIAALVFIGRDGDHSPPARNRRGAIDPQTFRSTRRVDTSTAAVFRHVLTSRG
jgi:hypothetical protein